MRVLLINPNRYQSPPVPPIGFEYIAGCLRRKGQSVEILDLCFSEDIYHDLDNALASFSPDIAGITVRNVDSVLYHTNEFFLDEIRDIVSYLKSNHRITVLAGGSGLSTNPEGVLEFIGADIGIAGPAEEPMNDLEDIVRSDAKERILYGKYTSQSYCCRLVEKTDYRNYFNTGGIAGFETHKGCSSSCIYCTEADKRVVFKDVQDVIGEIQCLSDRGYQHFHLCDSEFNEDLDFCIEFCTALKHAVSDIQWAAYMKPAHSNQKLFRLMKDTGVYLITLTVDSFNKCPQYWEDIEKMIFLAKAHGIKLAVDFLTGFPYEDDAVLVFYLDLFRRLQPDRVSINTYIRLYKTLPVTHMIMKDETLKGFLLRDREDNTYVRPVFYSHLSSERLKEFIRGDELFRIEGLEKGVNYSRV